MNIPAALELAIADVMRNTADVGSGTIIRAWQTLTDEQVIAMSGERLFPMIDVRASAPSTENQITWYCDVMVLCGTYNDDDKNHSQISLLYEAAQTTLDALHSQMMNGQTGTAYDLFVARMAELYRTFVLGGFQMGGGSPPYDEGGVNFMGQSIQIHYCTS